MEPLWVGGTKFYLDGSGPDVIKLFPHSTQLSMKFYLLINNKLLINTVVFLLSLAGVKFSKHMNMKIS